MPWVMNWGSPNSLIPFEEISAQNWRDLDEVNALLYGGRIAEEDVPRRFRLRRQRKTLPDALCVVNGYLFVSPQLRTLLEAHDLGSTCLYDIELFDRKGQPNWPGYALLHATAFKDTFLPEASRCQSINEDGSGNAYRLSTGLENAAVLDRTAGAGVDLWREKKTNSYIYVSDRLAAAWKRERIKGPELFACIKD